MVEGTHEAIRVPVSLGRSSVSTIEVVQGLQVGDQVILSDMSQWSAFNDVYKSFFVDRYPARSAMGVNGLALGAQVEIDCIAAGAGKH